MRNGACLFERQPFYLVYLEKKTYRDHALAVVYMSDIIQRDSVPTLQRCVPPRESGKLTTRQRQRGSKTYRN